MASVSEHRVKITIDDQASAAIEKMGKSMQAQLGLIKMRLEENAEWFRTMRNAGLAGAAWLTALGTFSVKTASSMQDLRVSLDTLTGSAEKGRDLFLQIQKEAGTTPFDSEWLARATSTMLSFGIETEEVIWHLRMLGDISLGDANKLQSLALVFGQIRSAGRLTGGDLLQLINVGFNPLEVISKQTGKSMSELRDEMSDGAITYEMVADAMKVATAEWGRYFQGMDNASRTFSGRMAALWDSVWVALAALGWFANWEIIEGGLLDMLTRWIAQAQPYLDGIAEWASNNPQIAQNIMLVVGGVSALLITLGTLGLVIPSIVNWFVAVKLALASLLNPVTYVVAAIAAFGVAYKTNFLWFKDIVDATVGWVWERLQEFGEWLLWFWEEHGAKIMESVMMLWNSVSELFRVGMEAISSVISAVWNTIKGIWETYQNEIIFVVNFLWETVKMIFSLGMNALLIAVQFGLDMIRSVTDVFMGLFTGNWSKMWNGLKNIVLGAWNGIKAIVTEVATALNKWIKDVFGVDLGVIFWDLWEKARGIAETAVEALDTFVRPILEWLVGFVESLIGGIQRAWDKAKEVASWAGNAAGWFSNTVRWIGVGNVTVGSVADSAVYGVLNFVTGQNISARASGWPVSSGSKYLVGERWPELFVPKSDGYIVPNNKIGGATININMGGVVVQNEADESRLAEKIKDTLYREMRLARLGF